MLLYSIKTGMSIFLLLCLFYVCYKWGIAQLIGDHMNPKIFPVLIIILNALAGIVYMSQGNWRMFIYFVGIAIINAVIIF